MILLHKLSTSIVFHIKISNMRWFLFPKVFALSVEKKSSDMKKQKKKQEKLVMKMLPKVIVDQVMKGDGNTVAETFDSATLYFSSVTGFINVSKKCRYFMLILKSTKLVGVKICRFCFYKKCFLLKKCFAGC